SSRGARRWVWPSATPGIAKPESRPRKLDAARDDPQLARAAVRLFVLEASAFRFHVAHLRGRNHAQLDSPAYARVIAGGVARYEPIVVLRPHAAPVRLRIRRRDLHPTPAPLTNRGHLPRERQRLVPEALRIRDHVADVDIRRPVRLQCSSEATRTRNRNSA